MAFALVIIFLLSSPAYAGYQNLAIAAGQSDFYYDAPKNQTFARFAANDPIYNAGTQTVNTTRPYNVVGIDGKTYQTTITRTAAADIPKVGAALSKFAQRVGPLSMALATVDLVCTLSNICKSAAGLWEIPADPEIAGFPPSLPSVGFYYVAGLTAYKYPSPEIGCGRAASVDKFWGNGYTGAGSGIGASACTVTKTDTGTTNQTSIQYATGTCPTNYTVSGSTCVLSGSSVGQTPTASDWTNKETALSTPEAAERLAVELEPMPIQVPTAYAPLQLPIGRITTTNRDAIGNATGTKVTEKKLEIEDAATLQEPNRSKIEEISTETTFDLNGNPVSSTETKTETATQTEPQPEPPVSENIEIDFDESQDKNLEKFEVPSLFSYTSWGSGSCPADAVEDTTFGEITLSYAPVCEVAEGVRPFVILLALIGAFFIVSGSRT
ncbi:MAG: hypothetical protein HRU78_07995 [Gammaproteobacteria bacterium]|nr:MAG: hypothetical protein HRU78_07995 [Gammaproteobacteria bacterium]